MQTTSIQQIEEELYAFIDALTASKVLRLGLVWAEADKETARLIAHENGVPLSFMTEYSNRLQYFPNTKPKQGEDKRWADAEDNYLMAHYQTAIFTEVCRHLKNRTPDAIRKRVSYLGVNKK